MTRDLAKAEQHPLFPSGPWEGFYVYQMGGGGRKHKMDFQLDFTGGQLCGSGSDDIGGFGWSGSYCTERLYCEMTKQYFGAHSVWYQGKVDENGIWGIWLIPPFCKGGFHIWPKSLGSEEENAEAVPENMKLVFPEIEVGPGHVNEILLSLKGK